MFELIIFLEKLSNLISFHSSFTSNSFRIRSSPNSDQEDFFRIRIWILLKVVDPQHCN
jgi:hypothetical protein